MGDLVVRVVLQGQDQLSPAADKAAGGVERLGSKLEQSGKKAKESEGAFASLSSFLRDRLVVTFGDVQRAAELAFDAIRTSAQRAGQETALRAQIEDFDAYMLKLRQVSNETVSQADLIASSSKALLLGIPADKIAQLLEIARGAAVATGTSVTQAFNDIVTGIGRASPLILDNLGLVVRLEETYQRAAAAAGKTVDELTGQERAFALLNAVIDTNAGKYKAIIEAQSDFAVAVDQGTAALDDFKTVSGEVAGGLATGAAAIVTRFAQSFVILGETIAGVVKSFGWMGDQLPIVGGWFSDLANSAEKMEMQFGVMRRQLGANADALSAAADAALSAATGLDSIFGAAEQTSPAVERVRREMERAAAAQRDAATQSSASAEAMTASGNAADIMAEQIGGVADANLRVGTSAGTMGTSLETVRRSFSLSIADYIRMRGEVELLATGFDALTDSMSRAEAVRYALDSGATLSSNGRRISFPGGGSRLTSEPGLSGRSSFAGSSYSRYAPQTDFSPGQSSWGS